MSEKQSLTSLVSFFLPMFHIRNFNKMLPRITKPPLYRWRGNAPFPCTLGGSLKQPCVALPHWRALGAAQLSKHQIRSRHCWLPARCRTNLQGMFPLAGSLLLAWAPDDINHNCCYLWFFLLFIWITAKTTRLSQIFEQLIQREAWQ